MKKEEGGSKWGELRGNMKKEEGGSKWGELREIKPTSNEKIEWKWINKKKTWDRMKQNKEGQEVKTIYIGERYKWCKNSNLCTKTAFDLKTLLCKEIVHSQCL